MNSGVRVASVFAAGVILSGCSSVTLTSRPTEADVFNETNIKQGQTPLYLGPLYSVSKFEVRKEGYSPQFVTVGPMSPRTVEVVLEKGQSGKTLVEIVPGEKGLEVRSSPVHAEKDVIERSPNVKSVRKLTDMSGNRWIGGLRLSPDSKRLVLEILDQEYVDKNWKYYSNLWLLDATASGGLQRMTQGSYFDRHPSFSPAGDHIYFSSARAGRPSIWRISADKVGGLALVTSGSTEDGMPELSPDGTTLLFTAFMSGSPIPQIWTKPLSTGLPQQLCEGFNGRWSPDGTKILFCSTERTSGKVKLWTMTAEGFSPTQLTSGSEANDIDPSWSPDGKQIVFASDRGLSDGEHNYDVWVMNSDGSDQRQLTTNGSRDDKPIFAKDGKTIYFRSNRGFIWNVWIMEMVNQ